ncbi:MAG: hypothetical protein EG828_13555 [Deltaproteobacteria bacterium]|nr:hypothetical protein [Deltaproteobacteria bacterium]
MGSSPAHIFNLRSMFTSENLSTLPHRHELDGMPEDSGRPKPSDLFCHGRSNEPDIQETPLRLVDSDISRMFRKRYTMSVSYNPANSITETIACQRLTGALSNADRHVYQLAELCDRLCLYNNSSIGGPGDQ